MADDLDEAADRLRMDLDIPAPRAATHSTAGPLDGLPERRHHVFAHLLNKLTTERAFFGNDAVLLQSVDVLINRLRRDHLMHCHKKSLPGACSGAMQLQCSWLSQLLDSDEIAA